MSRTERLVTGAGPGDPRGPLGHGIGFGLPTLGDWAEIEAYGQRGLEVCFQDVPIVRLDDGMLLAPDLGMVLPGLATRSVSRAIVQYASENEHVYEAASNVLGHVFERYVADLLEECMRHGAGGTFHPEFSLADGTESPDAMLVEQSVTLFEAKVTRYPWPLLKHLSPSSFLDWLKKVSGERPKTGRKPLEQGANFIDKWRAGDAECTKRLGGLGNFRYVVVTAEDLPIFLAWERFRDELWRPLLGPREQALDKQTLFISVRDLEALTDTLIALKKRGTPRRVESLLDEWRDVWTKGDHIAADAKGLKPSLKGYLVPEYKVSWEDRPRFVSDAFAEAWEWAEGMLR